MDSALVVISGYCFFLVMLMNTVQSTLNAPYGSHDLNTIKS